MLYKSKYLVLGAGPSGLTFANALLQAGERNFLVLESEETPGGLCRSCQVDASPFDIGGGHFLDVRRATANAFLFQYMPEREWNLYERDSRIALGDMMIHHPFEANIWEMDIELQVKYLKSIAMAGCNTGRPHPRKFVEWIRWKLGDCIADDYMLPYNRKMFGKDLNQLGTYWLEKLPDVDFEETLRSCLSHRPFGRQPGHAQFYYPKQYGYGELWTRMGCALSNKLMCGHKVLELDFSNREVKDQNNDIFSAEQIITTIPWRSLRRTIGLPAEMRSIISSLRHTSIQIEYCKDNLDTQAHWIYYPDQELAYHRILVRHNFCPGSRGYWTETNGERVKSLEDSFKYLNEYAYPLNTIGKNEKMLKLLGWCARNGVIGLGRWGEHQHYNSDLVVQLALDLAKRLLEV